MYVFVNSYSLKFGRHPETSDKKNYLAQGDYEWRALNTSFVSVANQ
jgi:hypothetical protein